MPYTYAFQQKVAELLLEGKNVILSVPTGAGKTWASIMPFLYATYLGKKDFPQKLIYSLPLRTLANSIYADVNEVLSRNQVLGKECLTSIQTGEYSNDPYFENDIIFSTIDQTLSNFLCFPLALSHSQANINAGAIIGSYLIFDEFHLLDSKLSMKTTIGMLRLLNNLCRVCIMTATLTDEFINFLKDNLTNFEVVSIKDFPEDVNQIKSLIPEAGKTVKKSIHICDSCLNAHQILEKHKNKTIVICNRVETAQRLFLELKAHKKEKTKLLCIHSRFFDKDRKRKEAEIKEWFGKGSTCRDVILVSTQVIEAGMDISSDVMFTEISPINSFLQRAGRCARFANEYGDVYVCDVLSLEEKELLDIDDEENSDEIKQLNSKYLPYSKELCVKSLEILKEYSYIDENTSAELVNEVLSEDETRKSNEIQDGYNQDKIRRAWYDCDKGYYKNTIRNIQSIEVVLLDLNNHQNQKIYPWKYETISIYRWSFVGWVKRLMQENSDEWIVAKAEQSTDSSFDFEWEDSKTYYLRYMSFEELKYHYDIVFVNNRFFDYNDAGLFVESNSNGKISPLKEEQEQIAKNISYKKDTFYQHNKVLLNCYEMLFKPQMDFIFTQLSGRWKESIDWDKWIKIMICFHDFGKLNMAWQKPMLAYQRKKMEDNTYFEILAHTDYDESVDADLATLCKIKNKPPHAGIGAAQVYDVFCEENDDVARVFACAILKHHSVATESMAAFEISPKFLRDLSLLLKELGITESLSLDLKGKQEKLSDFIPDKEKEWLTYLFFVRILRLCDQKATESIEKYYRL